MSSYTRYFISLNDFYKICEGNGFIDKEDKLQLSEYLHDIGVILHFQNIILLKKIIILKPDWATKAVYKVIDDEVIVKNFGEFAYEDLKRIWKDKKYDDMYDELIKLMTEFRLCYKIPNSERYLLPQLLTENQPKIEFLKNEKLTFYYEYKFMPKGILSKIIVGLHEYIYDNKVWKSGVVIVKNNTYATFLEYYNSRQIKVYISGENKKELHTIIRHEINKIHKSYSRKLDFNIFIPCICRDCRYKKSYYYTFEEIRRYKNNNRSTIECRNSFENVLIDELLGDYYCSIMERKEDEHINEIKIQSVKNVNIFGNDGFLIDENNGQMNISKDKSKINSTQNNFMKNCNEKLFRKELNFLKTKLAENELYDEAKIVKEITISKDILNLDRLFRLKTDSILNVMNNIELPYLKSFVKNLFDKYNN